MKLGLFVIPAILAEYDDLGNKKSKFKLPLFNTNLSCQRREPRAQPRGSLARIP